MPGFLIVLAGLLCILTGGLLVAGGLMLYHWFVKPDVPTVEEIKSIITETIVDELSNFDYQEDAEDG